MFWIWWGYYSTKGFLNQKYEIALCFIAIVPNMIINRLSVITPHWDNVGIVEGMKNGQSGATMGKLLHEDIIALVWSKLKVAIGALFKCAVALELILFVSWKLTKKGPFIGAKVPKSGTNVPDPVKISGLLKLDGTVM